MKNNRIKMISQDPHTNIIFEVQISEGNIFLPIGWTLLNIFNKSDTTLNKG